jgi:hypothetical protein
LRPRAELEREEIMNSRIAVLSLVGVLVGCGGSVFDGKVAGNTLDVKDAIFIQPRNEEGKVTTATVYLSDKTDLCATLKAGRRPKNASIFSVTVMRSNGTAILSPEVGEYTIVTAEPTGAGSFAGAGFSKYDANCTNTLADDAVGARSGLVKVSEFRAETNGRMSGTFDVTIGVQADKVKGSFGANFCDLSSVQNLNCE